ncbi:MAG: T9SS type A sorting domain-containing protein [Bacteroidota bacterium]
MKRLVPIFLILLLLGMNAQSQALFTETFNYTDGALVLCGTDQPKVTSIYYPLAANNVSGGAWTNGSASAFDDPMLVQTGALTYTGYSLSGTGKKLFCPNMTPNSSNNRGYRAFTGQQTIYYSLMVNLREVTNLSAFPATKGEYFTGLWATGNATNANFRGLLMFAAGSVAGTYRMGVLANQPGSTTSWVTTDLNPLTTYLVVVKYERNNPSCKASIWINPSLGGSEPSPDATSDLGTVDPVGGNTDVGRFGIYQRGDKPKVDIGGIKVATTWGDAPLPVELTSFTASARNNMVELKWNTATETNNAGFEIEKNMNSQWNKIGFVEGSGNSASPKQYLYSDHSAAGTFQYRLKQIDRDGKFTYSNVTEATVTTANSYALTQNYPNPFNPTTTITFQLAKAGSVKLAVYDLLGREVAVVFNGTTSAGIHSASFNASSLGSGIYFYKLETVDYTKTMKMTLVK